MERGLDDADPLGTAPWEWEAEDSDEKRLESFSWHLSHELPPFLSDPRFESRLLRKRVIWRYDANDRNGDVTEAWAVLRARTLGEMKDLELLSAKWEDGNRLESAIAVDDSDDEKEDAARNTRNLKLLVRRLAADGVVSDHFFFSSV